MRFIFTCGGTAGHINPALAISGELQKRLNDCSILYIGAENNMEMNLVPLEGYRILPVKITNISRGRNLDAVLHNAETVKNVLSSIHAAKRIIRDFKPDAVIGTGGYVCYPVIMAAHELGIPTMIHESNAAPGLTTRLLSKSVDKIFVGFEDCRSFYPHPEIVEVVGTPVRGEFSLSSRESARKELGIPGNQPLVLSVWGSLGAQYMNETVLQMIPDVCRTHSFRLIHSTGEKYYDDFIRDLNNMCPDYAEENVDIRPYIHDMARVMTAADLIICRAGASTLSELTYMGKPAILVPSPNVTNNHQEKNARVLEKAEGAKVICENEITPERLFNGIEEILSDQKKMESMGKNMKTLSVPDASRLICDSILKML